VRLHPVEALRRIWTPQSEIEEVFAELSPGTELDSMIRDFFCRILDRQGTITLDLTDPVPEFTVRWEIIHTQPPGARRKVTIWKEPSEAMLRGNHN
jgi:hypothetical protein